MKRQAGGLLIIFYCSLVLGQDAEPNKVQLQSAFVVAQKQVVISARETGTLFKFNLQPGDAVKAGQLIASLESTETRLLVDRAEVDLAMARQTANSKVGIETARLRLQEARELQRQSELTRSIARMMSESDLSQRAADVQLKSARADFDRAIRSREKYAASVSQSEFDRLKLNVDNANIAVLKAKQDKAVAELNHRLEESGSDEKSQAVKREELAVTNAENEHKLLQLVTNQREIALKLAREMQRRREFVSPIDGEVAETFFVDGEWVKVGDKIARVVNLDRLYAEGFVDAQFTRAQLKSATATVVIRRGKKQITIPGEVVFVSPEVDRRNRQFQVRVKFDNRTFGVSPGTPADVSIELKQ